jgi:predicted enzyme related to lactoylglutathione lyase
MKDQNEASADMTTGHGHFHWNELISSNREAAKDFYSETLGWTYEAFPLPDGGEYTVCLADGKAVGGMMDLRAETGIVGVADGWFPYIAVDDIDRRLERVAQAEGSVERPAFDIPGVGRIAIVRDRAGSVVGWITPAAEDCGR